jgi:hypothetical protein
MSVSPRLVSATDEALRLPILAGLEIAITVPLALRSGLAGDSDAKKAG